MTEKILIIDFGSQYTQLIARRVRELNVYCEIHPYNHLPALDDSVRGVIMSGSPFSVRDAAAPRIDHTRQGTAAAAGRMLRCTISGALLRRRG